MNDRLYIAAHALQGLLANPERYRMSVSDDVRVAVKAADLLLEQLATLSSPALAAEASPPRDADGGSAAGEPTTSCRHCEQGMHAACVRGPREKLIELCRCEWCWSNQCEAPGCERRGNHHYDFAHEGLGHFCVRDISRSEKELLSFHRLWIAHHRTPPKEASRRAGELAEKFGGGS